MKNLFIYINIKKIKYFLIFVFIIAFGQFTQAQTKPNVLWAKQFGAINARGIATDNSQNIYLTGRFAGTADFGNISLTATGSAAPYVVKTNSLGEVLWAKQFGGSGMTRGADIVVDALGNVYTTGTFGGTASFDNLSFTTDNTYQATFVVKQNTSGEVLWAVKFDDLDQTKSVLSTSISIDTQENIYIAGNFNGQTAVFGDVNLIGNSDGNDTGFLVKQDNSGNVLWAKSFEGTGDVEIRKIVSDTNDNIYITGFFWDTANFGDITLVCSNLYNVFVAKINDSGDVVWAKNFGEESPGQYDYSGSNSIALDIENNIYVSGFFKGVLTANINPISSFENHPDSFVLKIDNSGNLLWTKAFKTTGLTSSAGDIITDNLNNMYIVGYFGGTIYPDQDTPLTATGVYNGYMFKMNSLGNIEWADSFGGLGNELVSRIIVNTEGDLYAVGGLTSATQFGPYMLAPTQNGVSNVFLLKLSSTGLSINETETQKWSFYPNPVRDFMTIELMDNNTETFIEVFNTLGQKIKMFENISNTKNIDLSDLKTGIYLLKINSNGINQTIKIKKQ